MKSLEEQMAFYAAYHRNPRNRATHFIGVPAIIFAILIPMAWLRVPIAGFELTGALLFVAVVLFYYFVLDVPLALTTTVFVVPLVYAAEWIDLPRCRARVRVGFAAGHAAPGRGTVAPA